jgi:glycosyltransferase involved in cell wall biosynthesis
MNPTISVVVTVYNRFELTKRAVESVLAQTLPVSEIILIDDGSFDGTSELLPQHIAATPAWREKVHYFHQENQGAGAARNTGIAQVTGEWLTFIDNDDLWLPQKLEWQFRALGQFEECGACITDAWFMNNLHMKMTLFQLTGRQHSEAIGLIQNPPMYILEKASDVGGHPVWLQNLLVRTDLARQAGGFDPKLRCGEDDDFVFRLACETKFCFVNMPMVLIDRTPPAERHVGPNTRWDDADYRLQMAQLRYEKRLGMSKGLPSRVRESIRRDLSAIHSGWANWFLQKEEYARARQAVTEAARIHLTPNIAMKWALTRSIPKLARKMALMRDESRRRRTYGIG